MERGILVLAVTLGVVVIENMVLAAECPQLVTKAHWDAGPVTVRETLSLPVPYVVIHHTYIPGPCNNSEDCSRSMRAMQSFHQGKGWNDIGYNFIIGGDNKVYEGRGWDIVGAHSPKYNYLSVGISFIGDYRTELPSEQMLNLSKSVIECGIARGSISPDYKLLGHRQVRSTECPGDALFHHIQSWHHWDPMIDIVPRDDNTTIVNDNVSQSAVYRKAGCPDLVTKAGWNAAPVSRRQNMTTPVPYVIIHHTYIPGACNTSEDCASSMRAMQNFHQGKGWPDIGYNFVIGGDGQLYEGRGWDVVGTHSPRYNLMSIGIAFIGDYRNELPSEEMLNIAHSVIECGLLRGSIRADYKLLGHRQVRATECPGDALYNHIQNWSHWDPMIDIVKDSESTTLPNIVNANTTESSAENVVHQDECPEIVSKEGWRAAPVTGAQNLSLPVSYVVMYHTQIPGPCNTSEDCSRSMRSMQRFHQQKNWGDIGYNFVIGGDNKVYEGRGWDIKGVHSPKYNSKSIGIAFIGNYLNELPSRKMLDLASSLISCGVSLGYIDPDYMLTSPSQAQALNTHLRNWSHWDSTQDRQRRAVDSPTTTELPEVTSQDSNIAENVVQTEVVCPEIVSKEDWNASEVVSRQNMTVPVPFVVLHHTYHPGACNTSDKCKGCMRAMQRSHQGKGWNDIGYNFVIAGDNNVYEGRGWDIVGAHSPTYNFKSIGISFIGDYRTELPGEEMLNLARSLIECGVDRGSISPNYTLVGHRQVRSTECPGEALYNHIQSWPHWSPMIDIIPRVPASTTAQPTSTYEKTL